MLKLHIGAGPNHLEGWENLQQYQCDITKPLPFGSDSVDFLFLEHVLEHVTPLEGFRFLKEARRVLKPGGVIRVVVPDVVKIWQLADDDYFDFVDKQMDVWWKAAGAGSPQHPCDDKTAFETILCCHGHKAAYTKELLYAFIAAAGLDVIPAEYGESKFPELNGIDSHWKLMGIERCKLESVVAEGKKPWVPEWVTS
jgi:predicted SAM-dependent methyltransferase